MTPAVQALFKIASAIPHLLAPGETQDEWDERVEMIVTSNYEAAAPYATGKGWTRFEIAAATTVLEGNETRFDKRIHAGEKHPIWTQDDGMATCLGQHHVSKSIPPEKWAALAGLGLDATNRCAQATTMMLVQHARQCGVFIGQRASKNAVAQAFASYGSGGKCAPNDDMWARGAEWEKLMFKFGPKPDVPGHHRVPLNGVPAEVREEAARLVAVFEHGWADGTRPKIGEVFGVNPDGVYKMRLERHAGGKIGVSVFAEDSPR
jgi:hypothetical protein